MESKVCANRQDKLVLIQNIQLVKVVKRIVAAFVRLQRTDRILILLAQISNFVTPPITALAAGRVDDPTFVGIFAVCNWKIGFSNLLVVTARDTGKVTCQQIKRRSKIMYYVADNCADSFRNWSINVRSCVLINPVIV